MIYIALILPLLAGTSVDEILLGISDDSPASFYQNTPSLVLGCYILGWQNLFSPYNGPVCRFEPSCSEFTRQAIGERGVIIGIIMGVGRLLRDSTLSGGDHPLSPGGLYWDTVESHW